MGYYHVVQHDTIDCGAACFAMICGTYGYKISVAEAKKIVCTDKMGTNIYGITEGAHNVGFESDGLEGSYQELMEGLENKEFKTPFIARVLTEDKFEHYVVVYKFTKKNVIIGDPAKYGITKVSNKYFQEHWLGDIIVFTPTEDLKKENHLCGTFLKYFKYLGINKKTCALVILLSMLITVINILSSFVFEYILDGYLYKNPSDSIIGRISTNIAVLSLGVIGLYLLGTIIRIVKSYALSLISKKISVNLSSDLYNHLIDSKPYHLSLLHSGEYLSRFYDSDNIKNLISVTFFSVVMDLVMAIASSAVLFYISPLLSLIVLGLFLLYIIVFIVFSKPIKKSKFEIMDKEGKTLCRLKEYIDCSSTIKSYTCEDKTKEKTLSLYKDMETKRVKSNIVFSIQDALVVFISLVSTVLILWVGSYLCNDSIITIGQLILFYYLMNYFFIPVEKIGVLQPEFEQAIIASHRLLDIYELDKEKNDGIDLKEDIHSIEISNVDFRYGSRKLILNQISLKIEKGKKIAVVGESGCGKTTIAKLLMGFNTIESGNILINGKPIEEYNIKNLRSQISYISQDTLLLSESIYENLRMGDESISNKDIEEACQKYLCDKFICELDCEYDTVLEENGRNLSGGQRQRLAIARAMVHKPKLLIMDEATSNLDSLTEDVIIRAIQDSDTACMIIAHRLKTIKECDYIYVLDKGTVAEEGTHEELLEKHGIYASYWEK